MYKTNKLLGPFGMPIPEQQMQTVRDLLRGAANNMRSAPGVPCPLDMSLAEVRREGDTRTIGVGFSWNLNLNQVECFLIDIKRESNGPE